MNSEVLDKANELSKRIEELEGFMFWCSGKEEGFWRYPAAIVAVKRKWYGAVESQEYSVSDRLQDRIAKAIEDELALLQGELEAL